MSANPRYMRCQCLGRRCGVNVVFRVKGRSHRFFHSCASPSSSSPSLPSRQPFLRGIPSAIDSACSESLLLQSIRCLFFQDSWFYDPFFHLFLPMYTSVIFEINTTLPFLFCPLVSRSDHFSRFGVLHNLSEILSSCDSRVQVSCL